MRHWTKKKLSSNLVAEKIQSIPGINSKNVIKKQIVSSNLDKRGWGTEGRTGEEKER